MENLDLREILKNVPKGTKLYSPLFGECSLYDVNSKIELLDSKNNKVWLYYNGKYNQTYDGECLLFPSKENRDWNTFCPFKDGDILYVKTPNTEFIFIYKNNDLYNIYDYVASSKRGAFYYNTTYGLCDKRDILNIRLATKEEKEKLLDIIKENGYKWNAETKTLEKFITPKFKIGDKVLLNNQVKVINVVWDSKNNEVIYTLETNINGAKTQYQVFNYDLQPYEKESYKEDAHTPPGITITDNGDSIIVEYVK